MLRLALDAADLIKRAAYRPQRPPRPPVPQIRPVKQAESWELSLTRHAAKKAGVHLDLRVGDPKTGHGHSWALRHWPAKGEKRLAVRQPDHPLSYFDFTGRIPTGYGAGTVERVARSTATVAKSGPDRLSFTVRSGPEAGQYHLIRTAEQQWLLVRS